MAILYTGFNVNSALAIMTSIKIMYRLFRPSVPLITTYAGISTLKGWTRRGTCIDYWWESQMERDH
jgi:hypothetical protein